MDAESRCNKPEDLLRYLLEGTLIDEAKSVRLSRQQQIVELPQERETLEAGYSG